MEAATWASKACMVAVDQTWRSVSKGGEKAEDAAFALIYDGLETSGPGQARPTT